MGLSSLRRPRRGSFTGFYPYPRLVGSPSLEHGIPAGSGKRPLLLFTMDQSIAGRVIAGAGLLDLAPEWEKPGFFCRQFIAQFSCYGDGLPPDIGQTCGIFIYQFYSSRLA